MSVFGFRVLEAASHGAIELLGNKRFVGNITRRNSSFYFEGPVSWG